MFYTVFSSILITALALFCITQIFFTISEVSDNYKVYKINKKLRLSLVLNTLMSFFKFILIVVLSGFTYEFIENGKIFSNSQLGFLAMSSILTYACFCTLNYSIRYFFKQM